MHTTMDGLDLGQRRCHGLLIFHPAVHAAPPVMVCSTTIICIITFLLFHSLWIIFYRGKDFRHGGGLHVMTTLFAQLFVRPLAYYIQGGKQIWKRITLVDRERVRKVQLCSKNIKQRKQFPGVITPMGYHNS